VKEKNMVLFALLEKSVGKERKKSKELGEGEGTISSYYKKKRTGEKKEKILP